MVRGFHVVVRKSFDKWFYSLAVKYVVFSWGLLHSVAQIVTISLKQ